MIMGVNPTSQVAVGDRPASQANGSDAVANAVRNAAARQGGLAPFMADVEQRAQWEYDGGSGGRPQGGLLFDCHSRTA